MPTSTTSNNLHARIARFDGELAKTSDHSFANPEAEFDLLGCIFFDPLLAVPISLRLPANRFQTFKNAAVFHAVLGCLRDRVRADVVNVGERLGALLSEIGVDYLVELQESCATAVQWEERCDSLQAAWLRREIYGAAVALARTVCEQRIRPPVDVIEEHFATMNQLVGSCQVVDNEPKPAAKIAATVLENIAERQRTKKPVGLSTGFLDLDKSLAGLQPGQIYVVAARPSCGKTTLGLNIAESVAQQNDVLFFSLEMSNAALVERLIAAKSRVTCHQIQSGLMGADDVARCITSADELPGALYLCDRAFSALEISAVTQRFCFQRQPRLIVVDYLQKVRHTDSRKMRNEQIGDILNDLSATAKKSGASLLLVSQLNRSSEQGERPARLSDLRDSGSIEQDADAVLFIEKDFESHQEQLRIVNVAKNRNGPVGYVKLRFDAARMLFQNTVTEITPWNDLTGPVGGF